MNPLLHSEIFILTLVTGVYLAALWLYRKTRLSLLHPLLVSIPVLALGIRFLGIPFATFEAGSRIINFLLGPTVVALGYLLYEQREHLKANGISILTSVFVGSVIGIVSVVLIARWMGADRTLIASLEPKSVTTPIAMSIAQRSGGIPAIAAVVVIVVGIFGGIVGPFILDRLGIRSRIARGLALGSAAHGLGTARAMELGAIEGAISGLAIGVMGIMTAILDTRHRVAAEPLRPAPPNVRRSMPTHRKGRLFRAAFQIPLHREKINSSASPLQKMPADAGKQDRSQEHSYPCAHNRSYGTATPSPPRARIPFRR